MPTNASTYTVYLNPTSWTGLGNPTFTATLRLGDNSASASGTTELILNGAGGQLAWGTNTGGDVDSDVNYPPTNYAEFELDVPKSTSPTQSPAELTVGSAPAITYAGAGAYSTITNVLVEAFVNVGGTPAKCVQVSVFDLAITFYDASDNPTSNPNAPTNPVASEGVTCAANQSPIQAILATPAGSPFVPVRVNVAGAVQFLSTDTYYQNAGANLGSASMQCKIYVWTS
jgi:hypothetical protein